MSPIVFPVPEPGRNATAADEPGIGCYKGHITFTLPDGTEHVLDAEKDLATTILSRNRNLQPAIVLMPCRLTPSLLYAQCSFDRGYKEASGVNNFLRKGRIINYMRQHSVASLIAVTAQLAEALYLLNEPRIQESLYLFVDTPRAPVKYEVVRQELAPMLRQLPQYQTPYKAERPSLLVRIWRRLFGG
jgi:hypothetical protein